MEVAKLQGRVDLNTSGFDLGMSKVMKGFDRVYRESLRINQTLELMKNAWTGMANSAQQAFDLAERGAKKLDIEATFKRLAQAQGRSADDMLKQLQKATKGALSEVQGMALSTQSMMAGMDFDSVVTALQYLSLYAKATNKDFGQLTTTIMTGLARGSVLMLDDAGILIDQTSLFKQKAAELGRELSDLEKKQLLVNAAIDQMRRKMGALGGETETQLDQIMSLRAEWENFKDSLGEWALKAFGAVRAAGLGWQMFANDLKTAWASLNLYVETSMGELVRTVRARLMDVGLAVRNWLQGIASAMAGSSNPLQRELAETVQGMVNTLDRGLVAGFDANLDSLLGVTRTRLEAVLAELRQKDGELQGEADRIWNALTGKTSGQPNASGFDLSPSVGNALADSAGKKLEEQRKQIENMLAQAQLESKLIGVEDPFDQEQIQIMDEYARQLGQVDKSLVPLLDKWKELSLANAQGKDFYENNVKAVEAQQKQLEQLMQQAELKAKLQGVDDPFDREKIQILDEYDRKIKEVHPSLQSLVEDWKNLELATLEAARASEESANRMKAMTEMMKGAIDSMSQPLADFFYKFASTGKLAFGELVKSMIKQLQVFAAEKTARLLMEGLFQEVMVFVSRANYDYYGAMQHQMAASQAFSGAAIMGSFVAGSGLAGMAHDGIASIPEDGTWLLQKGERVVNREDNKSLMEIVKGSTNERGVVIEKIEINNSDEEGVMSALPKLQQAIRETVVQDIRNNGSIRHTIMSYT